MDCEMKALIMEVQTLVRRLQQPRWVTKGKLVREVDNYLCPNLLYGKHRFRRSGKVWLVKQPFQRSIIFTHKKPTNCFFLFYVIKRNVLIRWFYIINYVVFNTPTLPNPFPLLNLFKTSPTSYRKTFQRKSLPILAFKPHFLVVFFAFASSENHGNLHSWRNWKHCDCF